MHKNEEIQCTSCCSKCAYHTWSSPYFEYFLVVAESYDAVYYIPLALLSPLFSSLPSLGQYLVSLVAEQVAGLEVTVQHC